MTVRDVFGLIVRLVGLAFIVCGLMDLAHVVSVLIGLPTQSNYPQSVTLAAAGFFFVLGAIFFAFANLITRLVYGRAS